MLTLTVWWILIKGQPVFYYVSQKSVHQVKEQKLKIVQVVPYSNYNIFYRQCQVYKTPPVNMLTNGVMLEKKRRSDKTSISWRIEVL